jgi:hypothetical protein
MVNWLEPHLSNQSWRNIPISLIDFKNGDEKRKLCVIAGQQPLVI